MSSIQGDSEAEDTDSPAESRDRKRCRRCPSPHCVASPELAVFYLLVSSAGLYQGLRRPENLEPGLAALPFDAGQTYFVGLVLGSWQLVGKSEFEQLRHPGYDVLRKLSGKGWSKVQGFVVYKSFEKASVVGHPVQVEDENSASLWEAMMSATVGDGSGEAGLPVQRQLEMWEHTFASGKKLPPVLVRMSLALSVLLLRDYWPVFHVVPVWAGCRPSFRLLAVAPSMQQIRRFLSGLPAAVPTASDRQFPPPVIRQAGHDFTNILLWIKASRGMKQFRNTGCQKKAWAEVFAQGDAMEAQRLSSAVRDVRYEQLRRGRIRLDLAACLLFRQQWRHAVATKQIPTLCFFTDASPQWRGREMVATSLELHVAPYQSEPRSLLMPLLHIGCDLLGAAGKTYSLLWQCFLLVGPSFGRLLALTEAVLSFTVDLGTERMIPTIEDLLPLFCSHVGIPTPAVLPKRSRTFPWAVLAAGWHHIFDGLLQRGLHSCCWFPAFLAEVKVIVSFMRNHMHDMTTALEGANRHAIAQVLASVPWPHFAHWRWSTLNFCVRSISKVWAAFRDALPLCEFVKKMRGQTAAKSLSHSVADVSFSPKLAFCLWYTDWLGQLERWGSCCCCHAQEYAAGEEVVCWRKGRLLQFAWPHACREFSSGLQEAESWQEDEFLPLGIEFVDQCQAAVRLVCGLGRSKLAHLDKVPYLLARWGEGGIKEQALEQFASAAHTEHEALTLLFLREGSDLRCIIDRCSEMDALADPTFKAAIDRVRCIPLDDSKCERPHARAAWVGHASRASKWPWVAASVRLDQNIMDFENCRCPSLAHHCWKNYKSVLQVQPKRQHRNKSLKFSAVAQKSYWLPYGQGFARHIEDLSCLYM